MRYLNNPGNIRYNPALQGVTGNDNGFSQFSSLYYGYRAIITLLNTYRAKYGLTTIRGIISRYAPSSDGNATNAYINYVSEQTGIEPDQGLDATDLMAIVPAIVRMETGTSISLNELEAILSGHVFNFDNLIKAGIFGTIIYVLWKQRKAK